VLVPRYKLFLCHAPIKPDLLGFPGIGVFACGLRDHEVRIIWYHLVITWSRNPYTKTLIPGKPSKSGLIGV
jgi:hypothetical protein